MDEAADLINQETLRQQQELNLIPSDNYASKAVREAAGSIFTNKYAEGYPYKRFYGGQEFTDQLESLAIERAKKLFAADHANVQPHSGAAANLAVYHAWLRPGDTVLAMDLAHGGHLTHGDPVTSSGKLYNFIRYGMKDVETGEIDYGELMALAEKHRPKMIVTGFSSYPRSLDYAKFVEIGNSVGALLVADMAHLAGLIAAGVLPNPLEAGFHVMTMTTHKSLRGPRGGLIVSNGVVSNPLKKPDKTIANIPTLIDRAVFPGTQGGPHMNVIAAKAVAFAEAATPEFRAYAAQVLKNAQVLAAELMAKGCKLVTGGTDNHLLLIDTVKSFGISGGEAQNALEAIGITTNKNAIPGDLRPRFDPSGLRLGTPAVTTRGLGENEMQQLAEWIVLALQNTGDEKIMDNFKQQVQHLASRFPLPN